MSIRLMTHVWMMDIHSTDKMVLLALADAANDSGVTWIAITSKRSDKADLVKKTSLTDRTVSMAISRLEEAGHLTRIHKPGRGVIYNIRPEGYSGPEGNSPEWCSPPPEARSPKPSSNRQLKTSKGAPAKMHLVPDDWEPKDAHRDKARGFDWPEGMFEDQLERFREWEFRDGKTDFDRAFHRWLRVENDRMKGLAHGDGRNRFDGYGSGRRPSSPAERLDAMREGAMAALDEYRRERGGGYAAD